MSFWLTLYDWLILTGQIAQPLFFILGVVTALGVAFWAVTWERHPDYELRTALAFTYGLAFLAFGIAAVLAFQIASKASH